MKATLKSTSLLPALLASLPLLGAAQNTHQDSLLSQGELVGGRPHTSAPRTAAPTSTNTRLATTLANADPVLTRLLHESVDIGRVPASQLPDLYRRFLEATRSERRQWSARDWDEASATLARMNARYETVRQDLPLDERINVRSYQGEFRSLQGARRVKEKLDN